MTDTADMTKTPHIKASSGAECSEVRTRETVEAIVADIRHSAKVDGYEARQIAFLESVAARLQSAHDAEREALRDCRELNHKMVQRRCQQDDELERAESRLREAERDARWRAWMLANWHRLATTVDSGRCVEVFVMDGHADDPPLIGLDAAIDRAMEGEDG